ncbi:MAG TPA: hypothetical protein VKV38_15825 [Trebonia sp.]|nr:hypothetical protein [Trebonia sp.]
MFVTRSRGWMSRTGPTATASTAAPAAANRAAAARPSRTPYSTTTTSSIGQAVAFSAAAAPPAAPAHAGQDERPRSGRAARASPRQIRPSTGRSLPLTASGNAISGEPVTAAVRRMAPAAPAIRSAAPNAAVKATASHTRGSVAAPAPARARGNPNSVMPGRYGL